MASMKPRLRSLYRSLLRELPLRPHPQVQQHPLSQRDIAPPISLLNSQSPIHRRIRHHLSSAPAASPHRDTPDTAAAPDTAAPAAPNATTAAEARRATRSLHAAREFAAYLTAQRTYAMLLERYNPGMGMDETERIRLTARRVGMNLPVEFEAGGAGVDAGADDAGAARVGSGSGNGEDCGKT